MRVPLVRAPSAPHLSGLRPCSCLLYHRGSHSAVAAQHGHAKEGSLTMHVQDGGAQPCALTLRRTPGKRQRGAEHVVGVAGGALRLAGAGMWGTEFRVYNLEFRSLGHEVYNLEFRDWGLRFVIKRVRFRIWGSRLKVRV